MNNTKEILCVREFSMFGQKFELMRFLTLFLAGIAKIISE